MSLAPIALFTYNRLEHLRKTIDGLKGNTPAKDSELFIFSDGPKSKIDTLEVAEVRNFIKTISGFKSVKIIERSENWGLAKSIIAGVTEIVNQFGKVIVVEDDLVTSPYFLKYMNDGLELYAHNDSVISIHGYVYPVADTLPETFFIKGADCWGWATWKRGWDIFEPNGHKLLRELESQNLTKEFNFNDSYDYTGMLRGQIAGKNNSWAIRWYASAFLKNKLTLYPGRSLVKNIGNDKSGTHSGSTTIYDTEISSSPVTLSEIAIQEDPYARKRFVEYFKKIIRPRRYHSVRSILRKARRALSYIKNWREPASKLFFLGNSALQEKFSVAYKTYREEYLTTMKDRDNSAFIVSMWDSLSAEMDDYFLNRFNIDFLNHRIIRRTMFLDSAGQLQKSELSLLQKCYDPVRLKNLLKETPVGMPKLTSFHYQTSHNTIHHLYHLTKYAQESKVDLASLKTVIEWGGGYGNMARLLHQFNPNLTYVLIDLPIFTAIQATYLGTIFGIDRICIISKPGQAIELGKINIVPLDEAVVSQLDCGTPDLFISTWALSESTEHAQRLLESKQYYNAQSLLIAYQKKSDKIPNSEMIVNHLGRFRPFYHEQVPFLGTSFYLFCNKK